MVKTDPTPAPGKRFAWQCTVCGYIEYNYQGELPDDYKCPICGAPKKKFVRIEVDA